MKAKDINIIARRSLVILMGIAIDIGDIKNVAGYAASDEGLPLTDVEAVETKANELLAELYAKLNEE